MKTLGPVSAVLATAFPVSPVLAQDETKGGQVGEMNISDDYIAAPKP